MNRPQLLRIAALAAAALTLAGCGKQGVLEQPPPLFGARAKAEYEAQKAQEAKDEAQRQQQSSSVSSSRNPGSDAAPRTTRDVRDPGQQLTPLSSNPIPGAPNLAGAPISTRPIN